MELREYEETLKVLDSCFRRIKWRPKPSVKRRLQADILILCTGLRDVVLVDYDGLMPTLGENLCALFRHAQEESTILKPLRVMILEDMAYIIHVKGLAKHVSSSLSSQQQLILVDLEQSPPKMLLQSDQHELASELVSIQKLFASAFPVEAEIDYLHAVPLPVVTPEIEELSDCKAVDLACSSTPTDLESSEVVNLTNIIEKFRITIPTLNGWLLGYPVTYLFSKESAAQAISNLSSKTLHIFKIYVSRNQESGSRLQEDELMSFSMPCDMSQRQDKEPWLEAFLARMKAKLGRCKPVFVAMRMEIEAKQSYTQSIVL